MVCFVEVRVPTGVATRAAWSDSCDAHDRWTRHELLIAAGTATASI